MKKIFITLTLATLVFTSCKNNDNNAANESSMETDTEVAENADDRNYSSEESDTTNTLPGYDDKAQDWKSPRAYSEDEANRMADDITYNVQINDDTISEIRGYRDYANMRNYLDIFASSSPSTEMESELTLRESFDVFRNTIPYYLRRNNVNDAIKEVEKELKEYEQNRAKKNPSQSEHQKNINDIQTAFDNLEDEIIQARKKFENNRKDAMEEFMEEINDKSKKTQSERYRDAMEEYNEEMED